MEIIHDYVDLETAKLLKEKGFNIYQPQQYNGANPILYHYSEYQCKLFDDLCFAPEHWQVIKWLKLKYNIWISCVLRPNFGRFHCEIRETGTDGEFLYCTKSFNLSEEAELEAIKYCLNNLI